MFSNCKNTKKQGDAGLGTAIQYFALQGFTVLVPLTDSQDYDLAVDAGEGLKRVQVKTTTYKSPYGVYTVGLKVKGGNSKRNYIHKLGTQVDYDLLFVLTESGDKYLIPKERIKDLKSQLSLGENYAEYKIN